MNAYGNVVNMQNYMQNYGQTLPQVADPIEHLYMLERELDAAEKRTASMIGDLAARLDMLEDQVSESTRKNEAVSRELELEVVALANRINTLEVARAA